MSGSVHRDLPHDHSHADTGPADAGHVCWGADRRPHEHHRLEVRGLSVAYGNHLALEDIAFSTACGRCLALIGPNGAGKSSLLKALAGVLPIRAGEILWRNRPLSEAHQELAYLPQRSQVDWSFPVTVRGLVEMGRYAQLGNWRPFRSHDREIVEKALTAMELVSVADRQIGALSGGQQQRAFIARALAQEAHVLLLDEPFAGLDRTAQVMLRGLFRSLSAEGRLLVASHHDLDSVRDTFDEVLLLRTAQIAFGSIGAAFTPESVSAAYAH
ncbi:MAG TPA: metal ABC transporter ATP-binding protein [Verrucomicrobiales bacterium]|nr:metal ABC transporter ATP-binding protein [Verrucomicrobiales bacterium]